MIHIVLDEASAHSRVPAPPRGPTPLRVGFTDCYVQLDVAAAAVVGLLPANSSWPLALPNERALVGLALVFQGVYPDPFSSTYGLAVSNGLLLRLGW